jgi:hypothetical protein
MLRKRLPILLLSLAVSVAAGAQVSLVLQVPPVGVMQKNQLWNMALVYTGNAATSVYVQLTLTDGKSGQPVMTAASRHIFLKKGTNVLTSRELSPVAYDYLSPVFADRDPNGFLPVGSFKACYTVLQSLENVVPVVEDCIPVEVQPISPPQLNTPADTSTVETAYPQFSWLPPAPVNLFSDLTYDMLLVEVRPDQGSYEAIQQNIPIYNVSHLKDPVNLYPASDKPLDTGRLYAWRVIAMNEDQFITQSEVWTFKLAAPKKTPIVVPGGNFIPLRKTNERSAGVQMLTSDTVGVKYYSFEKDHLATVSFLGEDGKVMRTDQTMVVYGDNFLAFVLNKAFVKGKVYRIEIADAHHNVSSASFTIK